MIILENCFKKIFKINQVNAQSYPNKTDSKRKC